MTVPMGRAADRPDWLLQLWQVLEAIDTLAEAKSMCSCGRENPLEPRKAMNITIGNNVGYYGPHEHLLRSAPGIVAKAQDGAKQGNSLWDRVDGRIKGCLLCQLHHISVATSVISPQSSYGMILQSCAL